MAKCEEDIRQTQTKCKHIILEQYLKAWHGIIFWGLKNGGMSSTPKFVYVDCFAYKGIYSGGDIDEPSGKPVYGSPIIGIRVLDELLEISKKHDYPVEVYTILLEKNRAYYQSLLTTLRELGYENRIVTKGDISNLKPGQIMILNKDSTELSDELLSFTDHKDTWAFYLLDPFASIPYEFVKTIVNGKNHDVLINIVYGDLARKVGLLFSENANPALKEQGENWSRTFNKDVWNKIYSRLLIDQISSKDISPDEKEELLVNGYQSSIKRMDPSVIIKSIGLRYPDRERTMLHLYLTTHNPTGALTMNKVLYDTKQLEFEFRHKIPMARKMRSGQTSFLNDISDGIQESDKTLTRPDVKEITQAILDRFSGQDPTVRDIYRHLVNTDYSSQEVDKGIRALKKQGLCHYDGSKLSLRTIISVKPQS